MSGPQLTGAARAASYLGSATPTPAAVPAATPYAGLAIKLNVVVRGQSNAELFVEDGHYAASTELATRLGKLLGFNGTTQIVNVVGPRFSQAGGVPTGTLNPATAFIGNWVKPDGQGGWTDTALERGFLNTIATLRPADPTAILWLHSEYDSENPRLAAATWQSAVAHDMRETRAILPNATYAFVSAIPYGQATDPGNQAIKIGMEALSSDPAANAFIAARNNDADMNAYQVAYGGPHGAVPDNLQIANRAAAAIADRLARYAQPGSPVATAGGHIDGTGPEAVQALTVPGAPNQLVVSVHFDAATTLAAPNSTAATGTGWQLVDLATGSHIDATRAAVDPVGKLTLSFARPVPSDRSYVLTYAYGYGRLAWPADAAHPDGFAGRGNAIYDDHRMPIFVPATGLVVNAAPIAPAGIVAAP